jgi:multiple sugar transport system permease protein
MAQEVVQNRMLEVDSTRTRLKRLGKNLIAVVIAVTFLFPLYWILISTFKTDVEIFDKNISFWPRAFTILPWVTQLGDKEFLASLFNSFAIATCNMVLSTVLGLTAAYGLARFNIPFKRTIMLLFLVTQMMPNSLLLTPLYLSFFKLNLLNSYPAPVLAIATGSIPFIVVTLRPFFLSLPKSLDEAARIDGCNALTSFLRIMVPIARVGIVTCLVFCFLHGWNDLVYSMTFNVKANMRPLTANIYKYMDKYGTKWNQIMAYGMILVIPVVLIFVGLQKYIVGGLTAGAIKE